MKSRAKIEKRADPHLDVKHKPATCKSVNESMSSTMSKPLNPIHSDSDGSDVSYWHRNENRSRSESPPRCKAASPQVTTRSQAKSNAVRDDAFNRYRSQPESKTLQTEQQQQATPPRAASTWLKVEVGQAWGCLVTLGLRSLPAFLTALFIGLLYLTGTACMGYVHASTCSHWLLQYSSLCHPADAQLTAKQATLPPFHKVGTVAAGWADMLADMYENDTLPVPVTFISHRLVLEAAANHMRHTGLEGSHSLASHLDDCARASQPASDDLYDMLHGSVAAVSALKSYTDIIVGKLDKRTLFNNIPVLHHEFDGFLDRTDSQFKNTIYKADAAMDSLVDYQAKLNTTACVREEVMAPVAAAFYARLDRERSLWGTLRWLTGTTEPGGAALEMQAGSLKDLGGVVNEVRQHVAIIRFRLKTFREELHDLRRRVMVAQDDTLPMEVQRDILVGAVKQITKAHNVIETHKREKRAARLPRDGL